MFPALSICACGHRADQHLDFAGACDGATACDCLAFTDPFEGRQAKGDPT